MGVTSVKGQKMPQRIPRRGAVYYIRRVIPMDLRPVLGPHDKWVSLKTRDYDEAKRRYRVADVEIEASFEEHRRLRAQQRTTPAMTISSAEADAMTLDSLQSAEVFARLHPEDEDNQLPYKEWLAQRLERERAEAVAFLAEDRRNAHLGVLDLFASYAGEVGIRPATAQQWRAVIKHLIAFLGHDNAHAVAVADLRRWRDHLRTEHDRRGKPRSSKTINGSYLAAIRAVWAWAVDRDQLTSNPAADVKPLRADKAPVLRDRDLTRQEQEIILKATLDPAPPRLSKHKAAARRWVPWLCAYTGARVSEITQARSQDVAMVDGVWTLAITPDAGGTKNNKARAVPLHEHLIEQGFLEFADAAKGPLFYEPYGKEAKPRLRPRYKVAANRLAEWVRSIGVTDVPQPNHSWRHTFKTVSRSVGIPEAAADYIQGHAAKNDSRGYGRHDLPTLAAEVAKLPRLLSSR